MTLLTSALLMASLSVFAAEMKVDFNRVVGPIGPVNGGGQPPMIGRLGKWQMMHYIKDAGIPYSRLLGRFLRLDECDAGTVAIEVGM